MSSVERVVEYCDCIDAEPDLGKGQVQPDPRAADGTEWVSKGVIKFCNYSMRYRDNLDLVLRSVNLEIRGAERVGVVGRTGCGKSSLMVSLFRSGVYHFLSATLRSF